MATVMVNGLCHYYYDEYGSGPPLVLVHGAFVDSRMWDPQIRCLSHNHRVIRYDLRGHGRTGPSQSERYTIESLADDLAKLMDALGIGRIRLCGLSLGGMIAQAFAVQNPHRLDALVLCDTAVSVSLTRSDKLQRYVLFPKWAMLLTIRLLGATRFTRFAFWLAAATRSEEWLGKNESVREYIRGCMLNMAEGEYQKVYQAIYDFNLLPLERIEAPTLVLNGEHESGSVFRHTLEILRLVRDSEARIVPGAGHVSNMENPEAFNRLVGRFIQRSSRS